MMRPNLDDPNELAGLRVADVMTSDPITVGPRTPLDEVVEIMESEKVLHFPVVDDEGRVIAHLSERNVHDAQPSVLMIQEPEARRRALARARVEHVALQDPICVRSDAPLREAIFRMGTLRAGSLPVVDDGRLVGILTSGDLVALLSRVLEKAPSWRAVSTVGD